MILVKSDVQDRWHEFVNEHNDNCPTKTVKRATPKGIQTFELRKNTIKGSVKSTGLYIISLYINNFNSSQKINGYHNHFSSIRVSTNSVALGEALTRTDRSIRDHIKVLRRVGLIEDYEFHGSSHPYSFTINPRFLTVDNPVETLSTNVENSTASNILASLELLKNTQNDAFNPSLHTNFPNINVKEQIQYPKGEVDCVDKCLTNFLTNKENPDTIFSKESPERLFLAEIQQGGAAAASEHKPTATAMITAATLMFSLRPTAKQAIKDIWDCAKFELYRGKKFSSFDESKAMIEIFRGIFGSMATNMSDEKIYNTTQNALTRLRMAGKYFDTQPNKNPDLPYSFGHKRGYFDPTHANGFRYTEGWVAKNQRQNDQRIVEQTISSARIDFERLYQNKPPRTHVIKYTNSISLFGYYQNRLDKYGEQAKQRLSTMFVQGHETNFKTESTAKYIYQRYKKSYSHES